MVLNRIIVSIGSMSVFYIETLLQEMFGIRNVSYKETKQWP